MAFTAMTTLRKPVRDTLHWLPVPQRIKFKIALMAFDCISGLCPAYTFTTCVRTSKDRYRSRQATIS